MKRYHIVPYLLLSLLVCLIFGSVLLIYVPPMEDVSLDLSLGVQEDVMFIDPEDYDEKGWAVYTQDGDIRTDLTPDGFGGYTGLELGQTFYFSRVMEEDLDSPTLQIIPLESTFAVWLDDTLLYTDNPNLDLRIGHLTLPMNEWLREEAITVTLPPDYAGKTLTVAQSFPEYSETGSVRAYPTAVRLYCGYAYESALISESFRVAFAALMLFAAGVLLAAGAVYLHDISMMCLALTAFLYMTRTLIGTSFYWNYFGTYENSPLFNLPSYAAITLFVFLLLQAKKHRTALAVIMGLYTALVTANSIMMLVLPYMAPGHHLTVILFFILPPWLLLLGIILLLVLSGVFWQHESRLYKLFFPIACTVIPLILIGYALTAGLETVRMQMLTSITEIHADLFSSLLLIAVDIAALISALTVAVSTVLRRRAEAAAMAEQKIGFGKQRFRFTVLQARFNHIIQ